MGSRRFALLGASVVAATALGASGLAAGAAAAADVQLAVSPFTQAEVAGLHEGDTVQLPVVWANTTGHAVSQVVVNLALDSALTFERDFSNCQYTDSPLERSRHVEIRGATCVINHPMAPGEVQRLSVPVRLKSLALAEQATLRASVIGGTGFGLGDSGERGTSHAVTAVTVPGVTAKTTAGWKDSATLDFKLRTTADLAAIGGNITGKEGETASVQVGVLQRGSRDVASSPGVTVLFPAGVSVVAPANEIYCERRDSVGEQQKYFCHADEHGMPGHGDQLFGFRVRVDRVVPGAKGSVRISHFPIDPDSDPADDVADLVANGAAVPAPKPIPAPAPVTVTVKDPFPAAPATSAPATPKASATATAAAATAAPSASEAAKGPELASTGGGSSSGLLALGGAATVLAGAGLVFAGRRRSGRHTR
ncbi:LPXTG cell wall anchor domain-containing protein [Kitasatospora sp. NPDC002227]|uniref:LPXTG cell wall anchor domain-containing protein n=1 Tax=Kitasatospora sp. NPDC002227 TaxID=3154773 RepID=UPI003324814F